MEPAFIPASGAALVKTWTGVRCRGTCLSVRTRAPGALHTRRSRVRDAQPRKPTMGLIPLVPDWLSFAVWFYGAYRFYLGFKETSYQKSYRIPLSFAWPLFVAVNGSYRKNFFKAIKGSDDD